MSELDAGGLRFHPSPARYWIVGSFVTFYGAVCLVMLAFFGSVVAAVIHAARINSMGICALALCTALVLWACAVLASYARNAAALNVTLDKDLVSITTGNGAAVVSIADITKICFLDTLRGWMYIVIYTNTGYHVISNMMYSDKEFQNIRAQFSAWFSGIGKPDLIYIDGVTSVGLTRNKKLPPFIYIGLWKPALVYALILTVVIAFCLFTGFWRPIV
jgi:hypothetical protein